jgi:hypothetical protein
MTTDLNDRIQRFVLWAKGNLQNLLTQASAVAADEIGDAILIVDDRLGVEVANEANGGVREVIFTAFSNPELFPLVRRLCVALSEIPGWQFVALKPPRGFDFALTIAGHRLHAKKLEFAPISDIPNGIQLIPESDVFEHLPNAKQAEELAWLIVETGVGEELTARLQHIEFANPNSVRERHPILELRKYLNGTT